MIGVGVIATVVQRLGRSLSSLFPRRTRGKATDRRACISALTVGVLILGTVLGLCTVAGAQRRLPWYILPHGEAERLLDGFRQTDYLYRLRMTGANDLLDSPSVMKNLTQLLDKASPTDCARLIRYLTPFELSDGHPLLEYIESLVYGETPREVKSGALVFLERHMERDLFLQLSHNADPEQPTTAAQEAERGLDALLTLAKEWRNLARQDQVSSLREMVADPDIADHVKQATIALSCGFDKRSRLDLVRWIATRDKTELVRDAVYQVSWDDTLEARTFLLTQIKRENVGIAYEAARALGVVGDAAIADELEAYALECFSKPYRVRKDRGATRGLHGIVHDVTWQAIFHARARSLDHEARTQLYEEVLAGTWRGNTVNGKVLADVRAITELQRLARREAP